MPEEKSNKSQLLVLRIIWGALILGELVFAAVIMCVIWPQGQVHADPRQARNLAIVSAVLMLVLLPIAFVLRQVIYRPGPDGMVAPVKYATGNIVFYALCEGVAYTGLIAMMMHGGPGGVILVPAVAVALQIVNYPNGNAMALSPNSAMDESDA